MAIYMKYGEIKGEVTAAGFEERLAVESVGFGVSRPSSVQVGAGQGKRHTDAVSMGDLTIARTSDKASPLLFNEACGGKEVPCWIDFVRSDNNKQVTYLQYKLKNCLITSFAQTGSEAGASESMSINFTEIEIIHTAVDAEGAETQTKGKLNIATGIVG